uniref:Tegument protein VP22 n=1 Tax=Anatid alphaherpesvirus 2 TaxID=3080522 RepID=A0AAU0K6H4_9ALPH
MTDARRRRSVRIDDGLGVDVDPQSPRSHSDYCRGGRRRSSSGAPPPVPTAASARRKSQTLSRRVSDRHPPSADDYSGDSCDEARGKRAPTSRRTPASSGTSRAPHEGDSGTTGKKPRAPPGEGAVRSGKFVFSSAPESKDTPWRPNTAAFNKRVFCGAVAAVAAHHAAKAAAAVWDMRPPKNNAELEELLDRAAMKITVCEGRSLLKTASACSRQSRGADAESPRRPAAHGGGSSQSGGVQVDSVAAKKGAASHQRRQSSTSERCQPGGDRESHQRASHARVARPQSRNETLPRRRSSSRLCNTGYESE